MSKVGFAAAAILLASISAAPTGAQEVSDQAAQEEKKICRTQKMTGSLTRVRRTCLTKAQWDRLAESTRRSVDAIDRDGNQTFAQNPSAVTQGMPNGPPGGGL